MIWHTAASPSPSYRGLGCRETASYAEEKHACLHPYAVRVSAAGLSASCWYALPFPTPGVTPIKPLWIWSAADLRSEEHTSELQSLTNLVCRLLLEKKKKEDIQ